MPAEELREDETEPKKGLKKGRLSAVEREEIEKLHKKGRKISSIASKMNRTEGTILKALGIKEGEGSASEVLDDEPVGASA